MQTRAFQPFLIPGCLWAFLISLPDKAQGEEPEISASNLSERFQLVEPTEIEQKWKEVGWRTHLMQARQEAAELEKPIFLWIMVGNPQGCT